MKSEHISYAMRNEQATQALFWLNNPAELMHWSMPILEALMIGGALLALLHALKNSKSERNPAYLFTWLATIFYGLIIEIVSYNFVDNFWHGEFTVMLYYNHLPLYIMVLYPALLYPTFMLVRGMGLQGRRGGRILEACCFGFATQMFYAPFDNMGPLLNWWIWDSQSTSLQPFWNSVPSTSYLWMLSLSMMFCMIARVLLWERAVQRNYATAAWWLSAIGAGLATNLAAVILQTPVSILGQAFANYFAAGAVIAIMMLTNAWVYWFSPRVKVAPLSPMLLIFPVLWCSFFITLYCYFFSVIYQANGDGISQYGTPIGNYLIAAIAITMTILIYIVPATKNQLAPNGKVV